MSHSKEDETAVAERDREVVALFVEESLEELQRIEQLLLAAEEGRSPPDLLAALFRAVHTIKGTSSFLAFKKIASLSHVAEDLLALLRERPRAMRPEHLGRLVQVIDLLGRMIQAVRDQDDEGATDVAALSAELRRDVETLDAAPAETVETPAAPPAPEERAEAATAARQESSDGTVRVNVGLLDRMMNLMGELVLARNQVVQILKGSRETSASSQATFQRLTLVTSELQEQIMKTRMQPVARVFEKIPRLARDLCQATGKRVSCQIDGTATEIDKALVEAIRDPVMHVVRNAIDHGIETPEVRERAGKSATGRLSVRASHEGGMVLIEVGDDGRGMDPQRLREHAVRRGLLGAAEAERLGDREALELVFRPGFSTAERVTDISGRGVGMDVVRTHVDRAGGQVELESTVGQGTVVRLKMPLTLAIIPALLLRTAGQRFAIPQVNLTELVFLNDEQARGGIENVRGAPVYRLRGEILPLVRLREVLDIPAEGPPRSGGVYIIVVTVGKCRYGLVVDQIHDTEEIVIKPMHGALKRLACYSGATVLGDGGVALILDVAGVAAMAGLDVAAKERDLRARDRESRTIAGPQTMLVFVAGNGAQCAVPLSMVARLERVPARTIERAAGREVLQYRQSIVPLVRPEALLPLGQPPVRDDQQLVVFDFGQPVAMAVDSIMDVANVLTEEDHRGAEGLVMNQAVIFGKTTLILDVYALVRQTVPQFVRERRPGERRPRLLLADDSTAMRGAIGGYLRAQGIDVLEVAGGEAALRELRAPGVPFDAVVSDLEMPGLDGFGLLEALRREQPSLPVIIWTQNLDRRVHERLSAAGARACVSKLEREALMTTLRDCGVIDGEALTARRAA
jgi:two-component system chemotaxis sensor kinase CheA